MQAMSLEPPSICVDTSYLSRLKSKGEYLGVIKKKIINNQ